MSVRAPIRRLLAALIIAVTAGGPGATDEGAAEYDAKVALVYAIAKFVRWPDTVPDSGAPFAIDVVGDGPFQEAIESLHGKPMHGGPIQVRRLGDVGAALALAAPGRVLIVGVKALAQLPAHVVATELWDRHVLTVADEAGFVGDGGIIEITFVDDHLAFVINDIVARRTGLTLSSSLYNLAADVVTGDAQQVP